VHKNVTNIMVKTVSDACMHANPQFFIFFAIILHTRFQFRNGFHHKIRDIFMHNLRSIVNIFLNFLHSKFYITIDVRTVGLYDPDYMFVLPSRHVCKIWTMSLHDSDCMFVWSAMIGFYDPDYKILHHINMKFTFMHKSEIQNLKLIRAHHIISNAEQ
jgi:hypothetical protein